MRGVGAVARMGTVAFHRLVVRLLEGAAAVLLVVPALELWSAYRFASGQGDPLQGQPTDQSFSWSALAMAATMFAFRGPVSLLAAAAVLLGAVVVLARMGPASESAALRWEVAGLGGLALLFSSFDLVAGTAFLLTAEPEPGAPAALRIQEWAAIPWPLVAVGLLVLLFLCLLRLGHQADDAEDAVPVAEADGNGAGGRHDARADNRTVDAGDEPSVVEQIEAAERPEPAPRVPHLSSDGSTANGYDEFFRRR